MSLPLLERAPALPDTGTAACVTDRKPFDDLADHTGPLSGKLLRAAAKVCGGCPLAVDCAVRVHPERRAAPPRAAVDVLADVVAHLEKAGEASAPDIHRTTGLPLSAVRTAVRTLRRAGKLTARRVTHTSGNVLLLTLTKEKHRTTDLPSPGTN